MHGQKSVQTIQANPPIHDLEVKHGWKLAPLTIQGSWEWESTSIIIYIEYRTLPKHKVLCIGF